MQITRLRTKLLSAFITIAFGAALMGLFGIRGMSLTADSLHEVTVEQIPSIIKLAEVQNHFTWMLRFTQNAMVESLAGDKARVAVAKARMEQERRRFEEVFASYDGQKKHGDEGVAWSAVVAAYKAWQPHIDACWAGIDSGDTKRALDALRATVPFSNAVGEALRATMQAERAESEVWAAQAMASAARARLWTWVILFGTLAGALGLGWLVTLSITRPVERMTEAAARISEGDVDQRIEHQGADEVGRLADSFRKLVAYIRDVAQAADALGTGDLKRDIEPRSQTDTLGHNMARARDSLRSLVRESQSLISAAQGGALAHRADTGGFTGAYGALIAGMNGVLEAVKKPVDEAQRVLDRVAAGDLTARTSGAFTGDYARLMGALDTSTESLRQSLAHVATSAGQVADATRQIASSSQAVAQGASEQASALEETSAELIELSGATKRNASSAERADELARSAEGASSVGRDAMGRMSEAMQKIRASAEGTAAIIRDINEIAFQTNLLALNAAVEAARAGESGRGFAVVADEVRALALRSKEAAKRTEALIGESMALSQQGEDISRHVGSALSEIAGGVTAVAGIVAEIKDASVTQARGIEQINHALAQVDQATQAAAASAEEASSASEELAAQATELSSLVGKFDVHEVSKAPAKAVSAPRARSTIPSARAPVFHA